MTHKMGIKLMSMLLVLSLLLSLAPNGSLVEAATKKTTLKTKSISLVKGKNATIQLKNKKKKSTYTFVSKSKKIATVSKKGKIIAKKKGTTTIIVKEKYKSGSKKKTRLVGKVKVKVANASNKPLETKKTSLPTVVSTPTAAPTAVPTAIATAIPTAAPTAVPTAIPTAVPTPKPTIDPSIPSVLLSNGFEESYSGFKSRGSTVLERVGEAKTGDHALSVRGRTATWNGLNMDATPYLLPGNKYEVHFWIKQSGDNAAHNLSLSLEYQDMNEKTQYQKISTVSCPSGEWTEVTMSTFAIPEYIGLIKLYIDSSDSYAGWDFYLDDFEIIGSYLVGYPVVTADFSSVQKEVDPSMFGYILTPNYDVPDSRITLLGPILNRETIPVQNFQAIGDLDGSYYKYEGSVLQRQLEAYKRAKAVNLKYYMLMGMNASWTSASGNPVDSFENVQLKSEQQIIWFKQYVKDVFQYMKDNGVKPDFVDLTNEYWTGTEKTFRVVWEALREVYPDDIPAVGPGGVGFGGIPDFYLPYVTNNDLSLEGPSWHSYWTDDTYGPYSQLKVWVNKVLSLQKQNPKANGEYVIWEENNAGSKDSTDWTRSMSSAVRSGVDYNIKGCMEANNWNGMSDLLTTNVDQQNSAVRRPVWWVYYMFGQMSGQYVNVDTKYTEDFSAVASFDEDEVKLIIAKNGVPGNIQIQLRNQPFENQMVTVDLYKITKNESNGLEYQYSITPESAIGKDYDFNIYDAAANESWFVIVKKKDAKPSFFVPLTPDDGEVASLAPTFTWSQAQGATNYQVTVSENKDMSNPVISKDGITDTTYQVEESLTADQKYYWNVTAINAYGTNTFNSNTVYSFIAKENVEVSGQFGPYLPSIGAKNETTTPELQWSTSFNAKTYRVVVSKNEDLSDPVINKEGVKSVRNTGQFGTNSQYYYKIPTALAYETKYYWTVFAVNDNGERPINGPSRYFTTGAAGTQPKSFALLAPANGTTNVSSRTVLSWEESTNAFFYKLEVSANADMSDPIIVRDRMIYYKYTVEPNVLNPNTKYYWRATAYTKDLSKSTASSSGILNFTTEAVPCSPLLYSEVPQDGKVTVWFRKTTGAVSYKVKYGTMPGIYTKEVTGITEDSCVIPGLDNGIKYYFTVVAVNSAGESSIWNERSETPGVD